MSINTKEIPEIILHWSAWISWDAIKRDARDKYGITIPNKKPGVYEVKLQNEEILLTIGKTSDLRRRIKQGLVRGTNRHSSGERIRDIENTSNIVIRWAETNNPDTAKAELIRQYEQKHGSLPKHMIRP